MMISKSYKLLWVCFISVFTSTQLLIAQDFYVSDSNGLDNNSGTLEAPFKTINKGISMVSAGGTVYVMDGICLLYTSPSPRDRQKSRMPSSA